MLFFIFKTFWNMAVYRERATTTFFCKFRPTTTEQKFSFKLTIFILFTLIPWFFQKIRSKMTSLLDQILKRRMFSASWALPKLMSRVAKFVCKTQRKKIGFQFEKALNFNWRFNDVTKPLISQLFSP